VPHAFVAYRYWRLVVGMLRGSCSVVCDTFLFPQFSHQVLQYCFKICRGHFFPRSSHPLS
jgi:hypothetical protein